MRAYEITQTVAFKCGYTLRFPRCVRVREDKSWSECEHHDEIVRRVKESRARISATKRSAEDIAKVHPGRSTSLRLH